MTPRKTSVARHFVSDDVAGAAESAARTKSPAPRPITARTAPWTLRHFAKLLAISQSAKLLQALILDLPDPLACDAERTSNLVERARRVSVEPVPHLEDSLLPRSERAQNLRERVLAQGLLGGLVGQRCGVVPQEVAELRLVLVADRLLERDRRLRAAADLLDLQPEEIDQIRRSAQTPISLEKPVGDEDESEFGHFLTDETAPLPDEMAEETLRNEALRSILKSLSHRERRVLELRYGLDGEQPRTLDEVGRTFNVTRERIRQIENQSLKKLRALADAAKLREVA